MSNGPKMPWGKYRGDFIADIPSSYLVWLLDNGKVGDTLLARELAVEMTKRMAEYIPGANRDGSVGDPGVHDDERRQDTTGPRPTPPSKSRAPQSYREEIAVKVIEKGYRLVAHELHPDKGGTVEAMRELTSVRNALVTMARKA